MIRPNASLWVLLGPNSSVWVLISTYVSFYGFQWVLMCPYGSLWVHTSLYAFLRVFMGPNTSFCVLMDFNRTLWVRVSVKGLYGI